MKHNAIIRIVIYSICLLLLIALLCTGLGLGQLVFNLGFTSGNFISGSGSVKASEVQALEIQWAAGSISVETADTDTISFSEEGYADEQYSMVYEHQGDKLTIRFSKASFQIGFVSFPEKDLTITIPEDWMCRELRIEAASADVDIHQLAAQTVELEAASGEGSFRNCVIDRLEIETVSGNVDFTGMLDVLSVDAVSADVHATLFDAPREIELSSVSGDLELTLPESCGFTVEMDAVSGRFSSDYSTTSQNGRHIYGNGECSISISGVSGDVYIRKGT